jgi:hypothetical protein
MAHTGSLAVNDSLVSSEMAIQAVREHIGTAMATAIKVIAVSISTKVKGLMAIIVSTETAAAHIGIVMGIVMRESSKGMHGMVEA